MASIKEKRDAIKALLGMTALHADGEWSVKINLYRLFEPYPDKNTAWCKEKREEMAYYTTDAEDALATVKKMFEAWVTEAQRDVSADAGQVNDAGLTKPQQEALDSFREAKFRGEVRPNAQIAASITTAAEKIAAAGTEGGFLLNAPDGDVLGGVCLNRLPDAPERAPNDNHQVM